MNPIKVADMQAAGTAFLAGSTWVIDLTGVLQMVATLMAIVLGGIALYNHYRVWRNERNKDK